MEIGEVVACLADGHSVVSEETARAVCEAVGVPFARHLVMRWVGAADAFRNYGFVPYEDEPGAGVGNLELSYHLTKELGLGSPGSAYVGKGYQARANCRAIVQHFGMTREG